MCFVMLEKARTARKRIKELLGKTVEKTQNKKIMAWTTINDSAPGMSPLVSDKKEKLETRIGLNNLLEFLHQFGCEERDNSNLSCSFESVKSSNIDGPLKSSPESTMFVELF